MTHHDVLLGGMGDEELMNGLRRVALPMLAELWRRGITASISGQAGSPEIRFRQDETIEGGAVTFFRAGRS
jgi:hypothetical protein